MFIRMVAQQFHFGMLTMKSDCENGNDYNKPTVGYCSIFPLLGIDNGNCQKPIKIHIIGNGVFFPVLV